MAMDVNGIISIAIGLFICAILFPIALEQLGGANNSTWSSSEKTLYGLIGTVGILAVIVGLVYLVKKD